jgi:hypothetical protein
MILDSDREDWVSITLQIPAHQTARVASALDSPGVSEKSRKRDQSTTHGIHKQKSCFFCVYFKERDRSTGVDAGRWILWLQ